MSQVRAPNPPARLNRWLLAAIGLLLTGVGAFAIAAGSGLLRELLPGADPGAPLLPADPPIAGWAPFAAAAGAVIVGLLTLRWLLAQTQRRPASRTWHIAGPGDPTVLPAAAAAAAVAGDIETYYGITSASATLAGPHTAPVLHLDLAVDAHASVTDLRARVGTDALPRLRSALQLDQIPTRLVLRIDADSRNHRVRLS